MFKELKKKIKLKYQGLMRPLRNQLLKRYMDRPVILFKGKTDREEGGLYVAKEYSGLDNVLQLVSPFDEGAFNVPVWAKPSEVQVYTLDRKERLKVAILNVLANTIGRL